MSRSSIRWLSEYASQFGVELKGNTLNETKKLIAEEVKKVTTEVQKEYDLKEKVVSAIENEDYDLAYELLGIKKEVDVQEEVETPQVNLAEEVPEEAFSEESPEPIEPEPMLDFEDEEDFEEESMELEEDEGELTMEMEEDEEDEEEMDFLSFSNPSKPSTAGMQGVHEVFGDMGELEVEDLPDVDDDDFGFGEMLSGSKFNV